MEPVKFPGMKSIGKILVRPFGDGKLEKRGKDGGALAHSASVAGT